MTTQSLNILLVSASGRKEGSVTRQLSSELITALTDTGNKVSIRERDLAEGMPLVDQDWIAANFTPIEDRTADQVATLSFSDSLVEEIKAADLIIIGAPIYNFGVAAALKAWIDQIARARLTFKYTENGPVGLLDNKSAIIVAASGGTEVGSPYDYATGYLLHVLGFVGIREVAMVAADQLSIDADASLATARKQILDVVQNFVQEKQKAA